MPVFLGGCDFSSADEASNEPVALYNPATFPLTLVCAEVCFGVAVHAAVNNGCNFWVRTLGGCNCSDTITKPTKF